MLDIFLVIVGLIYGVIGIRVQKHLAETTGLPYISAVVAILGYISVSMVTIIVVHWFINFFNLANI